MLHDDNVQQCNDDRLLHYKQDFKSI